MNQLHINLLRENIETLNISLSRLKDLRNSIAHEYITENIVGFFGKVLEYTPLLKSIIERLIEYCSRYQR